MASDNRQSDRDIMAQMAHTGNTKSGSEKVRVGDFGRSKSTVVFLNINLSVLEVTLVVRRKFTYYYGAVYWRSHSSMLSGKIEGSQTRVLYDLYMQAYLLSWQKYKKRTLMFPFLVFKYVNVTYSTLE